MSSPDIRQEWTIAGTPYAYGPVDDSKLVAEIAKIAETPAQVLMITELIDAVREADSDQSCGCT